LKQSTRNLNTEKEEYCLLEKRLSEEKNYKVQEIYQLKPSFEKINERMSKENENKFKLNLELNAKADLVLYLYNGISFSGFSQNVLRYVILAANSTKIQTIVDYLFKILNGLSPVVPEGIPISLSLPLIQCPIYVQASKDIRSCYVVSGVNSQRTKISEKIISDRTGALFLDTPSLIRWAFRTPKIEDARIKLIYGGYLSYDESKQLILDAANTPIARYRG
jgi:hypothetical protein